jgi:hypothetical protein
VFISYARTEREDAQRIKMRLEAMGLSVFLDVDGLDGGDVFSEKLDREVKTAGCVLGLWSPTALSRPWVQTECDIGKRRGVLIPAAIHPFRDMDVPAPFWNIQLVDLTDLSEDTDDPNWLKLRRALARTLQRPDLAPPRAARPAPASPPPANDKTVAASRKPVSVMPAMLAGLALLLVAGAGGFWVQDPLHLRMPAPAALQPAASVQPAILASPSASPTVSAEISPPATPASLSPVPAPSAGEGVTDPSPANTSPRPKPSATPAKQKEPFRSELQFTLANTNGVSWVDWSPDGSKIVTVAVDITPRVWDANSGKQLFALSGHTAQASKGVFSPDSSRILTSSQDKTVKVWNASTGAPIQSIDTNNPLWGGSTVARWIALHCLDAEWQ